MCERGVPFIQCQSDEAPNGYHGYSKFLKSTVSRLGVAAARLNRSIKRPIANRKNILLLFAPILAYASGSGRVRLFVVLPGLSCRRLVEVLVRGTGQRGWSLMSRSDGRSRRYPEKHSMPARAYVGKFSLNSVPDTQAGGAGHHAPLLPEE